MLTTAFKPWMCLRCGYMMDSASHPTEDIQPKEGDVSVCLNCGKLYVLHGEKWTLPTAAELAAFSADLRGELIEHELARAAVVKRDLSKRGGNT